MFLDINKIGPEGLALDEPLTLRDLEDAARERIEVHGARLRGRLQPGGRGVHFKGTLDARTTLTCGRCLERFDHAIHSEFRLILVPEMPELPEGDVEVADDDVALFHAHEGRADTDEIATEQIYLNLPLKAICRRDCRGLCPACGKNLNAGRCSCETEAVDPRFAPILRFRSPKSEG